MNKTQSLKHFVYLVGLHIILLCSAIGTFVPVRLAAASRTHRLGLSGLLYGVPLPLPY